jgi:cyclophilin family peptidyl-prolyl cis-trans isomerase
VETLLYLNLKEAFQFALTQTQYQSVIASNLWRAKDCLTPEIVKTYYQKTPREAVYSAYRSRTKDVVRAEEIKSTDLETRYYGCLVCDYPETFLKDPAWQVRISAVNACNSIQAALPLLEDDHELVRTAALRVYLKKNGDPARINTDLLNPMQAEIMISALKKPALAKIFFNKKGLFSEISAPYLDSGDVNLVMSGSVSDKARIRFMENHWGKDKSRAYAKDIFKKRNSSYALQYLLYQEDGVDKEAIVRIAREKGRFNSELQDFGYFKPVQKNRPLIFYQALLKKISGYRGFKIVTEKGTIHCDFFHRAAPQTCFNFITLVEKQYFNRVFFHRVIPAFVSQDGDPTGTGSGGPGYSIPCEYNEIEYDRIGRVGMALAGKDTGGSQYFITHLATPHLNHQYTIFAQVVSGIDLLAELCQYDYIMEIKLY